MDIDKRSYVYNYDLGALNLLKASWEAWRAATHVQNLSKTVRPHQNQPRDLSPVSLMNLSNLPTPSSPTTNGAESPKNVECGRCGRRYKLKSSLRNHQKWECGKEPRFQCPYCVYRAKQKMHVERHIERMHKDQLRAFYDSSDKLLENDVSVMFGQVADKMKNLSGKMISEVMSETIRQT